MVAAPGLVAGDKFNTPLDSPHAFNGWAEPFVATPNRGLDSRSVSLGGPVPALAGLSVALVGYRLYAQSGVYHHGDEIEVLVEYAPRPFAKHLILGTQIGAFREDDAHTVPAALGGGPVSTVKASAYTIGQF